MSTGNTYNLNGYKIAVVLPVHNEEKFIEGVIRTLPSWIHRIIAVDDASTDGSYRILQGMHQVNLTVIRHTKNGGVGAAIVSGYRYCIGIEVDAAVVMGGDGQMDPADLPKLVTPLVTGEADYVKGNRFLVSGNTRSMPFTRRLGNIVLSYFTRWVSGHRTLFDSQCGYTAVTSAVLKTLNIDLLYPRYGFPNDMILKVIEAGFRIAECPVKTIYADEVSEIRPFRHIPPIAFRLAKHGMKRGCRRIRRIFRESFLLSRTGSQ